MFKHKTIFFLKNNVIFGDIFLEKNRFPFVELLSAAAAAAAAAHHDHDHDHDHDRDHDHDHGVRERERYAHAKVLARQHPEFMVRLLIFALRSFRSIANQV